MATMQVDPEKVIEKLALRIGELEAQLALQKAANEVLADALHEAQSLAIVGAEPEEG